MSKRGSDSLSVRGNNVAESKKSRRTPSFDAQNSTAEAGRRILLFHFRRFVRHEAGTRLGKDIEELHDMRVATRRLRAAIRLFSKEIGRAHFEPYLEDLRWFAALLGRVRDLDVFISHLISYRQSLPSNQRTGIQWLIESLRKQRREARLDLLDGMDSIRFANFKRRFGNLLMHELPMLSVTDAVKSVGEFAPKALTRAFRKVLFFAPLLRTYPTPENYHALRIATKRFRYACEFFRDLFGGALDDLISQCVIVQDALGEVHDVDVRREVIAGLMRELERGNPDVTAQRVAIRRFMAVEKIHQKEQYREFESVWRVWVRKRERKHITRILTKRRQDARSLGSCTS